MRRLVVALAGSLLLVGVTTTGASAAPTDPADEGATYTGADGDTVTLRDTTVVLSAADRAALDEVTDSRVSAARPTAALSAVRPGQVIMARPTTAAPEGMMRVVTARRVVGSGLVLTTRPATYPEAFADLQVDVERTLSFADATAETPDSAEVLLTNDGLTFRYVGASDRTGTGYHSQYEHTTEFTGSAKLQPEVDLSLSLSGVSFSATMSPEVKVSVTSATELASIERTLHLTDLDLRVFTVMVGPVPITIHPQISFDLEITGSLKAGVSAEARYTQSMTAGFSATSDGLEPINYISPLTSSGKLRAVAEASLKVALVPTVYIQIAELAGPTLTLSPGLKLTVNPGKTPWWQLEFTLDIEVGGRIEVLGKTIAEGSLTLYEGSWTIDEADTPFAGVSRVTGPSTARTRTTVRLTPVATADTVAGRITWSVHGRSPEVRLRACLTAAVACNPTTRLVGAVAYLVLPKEAGDYTITAAADGQSIATTKTVKARAGAPSKPQAPQRVVVTPRYTGAALTWAYPADDGDSRVVAYTVTASTTAAVPARARTRTTTVSGSATSTVLTGLAPNVPYTVSVAAVNGVGTGPAVATTVVPWAKLTAGPSVLESRNAAGGAGVLTGYATDDDVRLSGNGRYVFMTVPGDSDLLRTKSDELSRVLVRKDRTTGTWTAVSVTGTGAPASISAGRYSVSDDGQRVVYVSSADPADLRLVLADLSTRTRTDLTARLPVADVMDDLWQLNLSGDGSTLVAGVAAPRPEDGYPVMELYRLVIGQAGPAVQVSTCPWSDCDGWRIQQVADSSRTSVSDDGRRVVFVASHVGGDPCETATTGTYLWDADSGRAVRYSPAPAHGPGGCVDYSGYDAAAVSGDGTVVAYVEENGGLWLGAPGRMKAVGPQADAEPGTADQNVVLSDDGRIAVFRSWSSSLWLPDGSDRSYLQVWACDRMTSFCVLLSSLPGTGEEAHGMPESVQLSDDGRTAVFRGYGELVGVARPDGSRPEVVVSRQLTF